YEAHAKDGVPHPLRWSAAGVPCLIETAANFRTQLTPPRRLRRRPSPSRGGWAHSMLRPIRVNLRLAPAMRRAFVADSSHAGDETAAPPPAVASQASPQALASSRTRRM